MYRIIAVSVDRPSLTDLSKFDILNNIFSKYFQDSLPARSTVEVSKLPKDSRIEIEAIGFINE